MNSVSETLFLYCRCSLFNRRLHAGHLLKPLNIDIVELDLVSHLRPSVRGFEVLVDNDRINAIYVAILVSYRVFRKVFGPLVDFFCLRLNFLKKLLDRPCITRCRVFLRAFDELVLSHNFIHVKRDGRGGPFTAELLLEVTLRRVVERGHIEQLVEIFGKTWAPTF